MVWVWVPLSNLRPLRVRVTWELKKICWRARAGESVQDGLGKDVYCHAEDAKDITARSRYATLWWQAHAGSFLLGYLYFLFNFASKLGGHVFLEKQGQPSKPPPVDAKWLSPLVRPHWIKQIVIWYCVSEKSHLPITEKNWVRYPKSNMCIFSFTCMESCQKSHTTEQVKCLTLVRPPPDQRRTIYNRTFRWRSRKRS